MSQLPRRQMMIDPATGLPYPIDPGVDPTMGMGTPPPAAEPGFMSKLQGVLGGPQGLMNLGSSLMAASGPSPVKQGFGSILGQSLLQNQQFQQQQGDSELKKMLLMSQIQKNKKQQQRKLTTVGAGGAVLDENGKVIYANPTKQNDGPATVQEWEYYNSLLPDDQKRFLEMKRNQNALQLVDVAGGKSVFNKASGAINPVTSASQEAAGAAQIAGATSGAKVTSEAVATAKLDLPRLEQNTSQALSTIEQLKKHPGLPYITGLYSSAPIIPGTPQAGADALAKQIQGRAFLEAFTTLKGGGHITEVEGVKAEAAIARLQRSQNRREYIQALTELEGVMNVGIEKARRKAGGPAAPRSREDILKQYGVQ